MQSAIERPGVWQHLLTAVIAAGCSGDIAQHAALDGGSDAHTAAEDGGTGDHDAQAMVPPFERPEYVPQPGTCGFEQPAFCDTFETISTKTGRTGELDAARWSATRGGPWHHASLDEGFRVGPALLPTCRTDLPARALPNDDTVICDPTTTVPTRHLLTATAAQNYGLNSYRIRQPFDFAERTGTIKFDADLSNHGLGGWPAIVIAQDPSPAPSFDWEERGSGPRNGVSVEFWSGWCNTPHTLEVGLFTFADYEQSAQRPSFDCETPHVNTQRDALNHVEIYLTQKHMEVWASDPSPDGVNFPNFRMLLASDIDLPFGRGYVHLLIRNHATLKYWVGAAWAVRWDNVGFDGPVVGGTREFSALDSNVADNGLEGCMVDGMCRYRGDVIAEHPDDSTRCGSDCMYDGEARYVGYAVPRDDETPVSITVPGVVKAGATGARLALAATYPWFEWNGVNKSPTAITLRYRVNKGTWHDRPINTAEEHAFTDFYPELGGAGAGAGLLNQIIDLDHTELKDGDNQLEFVTAGTWTGGYRAGIAAVDLILSTP